MDCSKPAPIPGTRIMPMRSKWSGGYDPNTFDELPIKYVLGRIADGATLLVHASPSAWLGRVTRRGPFIGCLRHGGCWDAWGDLGRGSG
jgi:hypothetical protein